MILAPHINPDRAEDSATRREYLTKIRNWRDDAKTEAIRTLQMSLEYNNVNDYIKYLEGRFWGERRPRYLSGFYDNRMEQARYQTLSLLTDIRPTIDVTTSVAAFKEQANIAQNIIHYEWLKNDLDLSLVGLVDISLLFGNAFMKITGNTPGEMGFSPCGPDMVLPIQPGFHLQESTAVLYKTFKPLHYFKRRWPSMSDNLEQEAVMSDQQQQGTEINKPPHIPATTWNVMSPQMRYRMGIRTGQPQGPTPQSYPVVELQEFWVDDYSINDSTREVIVKDPYLPLDAHNYWYKVPPMGRLYPRKRLIVFAGDRLMYDGPSPYWHGKYPFAMLRLNPVTWSFWGLSKYRSLVPLNKAINEIGAGTMDLIKRALNPQMVTREGGVPKDAWERFFPNMPGGKLRLGPTADVTRDVRYMDSPQLPNYVFSFLAQYLGPEIDRMAGAVDTAKLASKKQVPGGESLEQMRDMANPYVRLEGRYVEAFLRDAGDIAISNIFQFYTAKRRLRILGGDGITMQDFDYNPGNMIPDGEMQESFARHFAMQVTPGSLSGQGKQQEINMAMTLFRMGAISRAALLRKLNIPDAAQIEKELIKEKNDGVPVAGAGGRTPRQTRGQRNGRPV